MRTVFEILPSSFNPEKCSLFCEVNNHGFSYGIKDEELNSFLGLGIFHYDKSKPSVGFPIELQIIFHQKEIFSKKFRKTCIVYSFPESVLIPFSLYDSDRNQTVMNMMFGDLHSNETILTDVIPDQSLYNCYRIPSATYEVLQTQFPEASNTHQYSLLLKEPFSRNDELAVIFYSQKIVVRLIKDGKQQLINSYHYQKPQDVSYTLLNICKQFHLENIHLEISGLLEETSALYKEIYKYFTDIEFTSLSSEMNYSEDIAKFPAHYFSYIFAIDSCE
ncbi:MAG TPA: DUF3822 family protein [Hanamia sp.]|nr:DUF3822 family protein [Hanamia sp.]